MDEGVMPIAASAAAALLAGMMPREMKSWTSCWRLMPWAWAAGGVNGLKPRNSVNEKRPPIIDLFIIVNFLIFNMLTIVCRTIISKYLHFGV